MGRHFRAPGHDADYAVEMEEASAPRYADPIFNRLPPAFSFDTSWDHEPEERLTSEEIQDPAPVLETVVPDVVYPDAGALGCRNKLTCRTTE
jgi:hypothetical protein